MNSDCPLGRNTVVGARRAVPALDDGMDRHLGHGTPCPYSTNGLMDNLG